MYNLKIISSTVRPGRKGPLLAQWIAERARLAEKFNIEIIDLGILALPMMNEAAHPSMKKYEHDHTLHWSKKIEEADAFIFVTAEYDYNYPAPLRNALEYLFHEWGYKAAGIVSYGGISAGTRAANSLKADLATLKIVPVSNAVNIPFFNQYIQDDRFVSSDSINKSADAMFKELLRWTRGLKAIKEDTE